MKLSIEQSKFTELLETAYLAVSPKPTDPILGNILLVASEDGTVSATGTNLNLTIQKTTTANVEIPGNTALPAKLLVDTVSNVRGEISLEVNNQACIITHNSGKCRLIGGKPEEFPTLPEIENPTEINLSAKKLQAALEGTLHCASNDETKLILTGINFKIDTNQWQAASTNGHKLAMVVGTLDREYPALDFTVPGKSLGELNKILSLSADTTICNILLSDKTIEFSLPNIKVTSRLLEGEYPKINSLIPRTFEYEFTLLRKGFESALKRVSYLAERRQKVVKILWELEETQATLYTEATDIGDAVDSVLMKPSTSSNSENISIGLNIDYVLEGLKHISTDEIVVRCNKPTQPVIICPIGGLLNQLYLVMPVEIKQGFERISRENSKSSSEVTPDEEVDSSVGETAEPVSQTEVTTVENENPQALSNTETSELETPLAEANAKNKKSRSRAKKEVATV
ncbi:DNA polymerase III subunit beta [Scytonema hofmannii PCC 7110]|uniref:DNA polymerase III subunit beta n=1 Tax=Scytonema hofmannii PCC 7110 TaxID=128403 RepID=A0A139WQH2_9CYAN|nr:DNA polymerase III subunit beta [Scytonema hofmannii]KYC34680.1 DNA polymerase III subunit beta [Scytonema hofmannii PCC 7110]